MTYDTRERYGDTIMKSSKYYPTLVPKAEADETGKRRKCLLLSSFFALLLVGVGSMAAIVGGSKSDAVPSNANEQHQGSERGDGSLPSACCVEDVTNLDEVSGEPEKNDDLTDDGPHVLLDQALAALPVLNGSIFDGDTFEELPNATFTPTIHSVSNESNTSDWRESPSTSLLEPIEDAGTVSLASSQHSETSPQLEDNLEDMASSSVTPPSPTVLIAGLQDDIISAKWSSTTEAPSSVSSTSSPTMVSVSCLHT